MYILPFIYLPYAYSDWLDLSKKNYDILIWTHIIIQYTLLSNITWYACSKNISKNLDHWVWSKIIKVKICIDQRKDWRLLNQVMLRKWLQKKCCDDFQHNWWDVHVNEFNWLSLFVSKMSWIVISFELNMSLKTLGKCEMVYNLQIDWKLYCKIAQYCKKKMTL